MFQSTECQTKPEINHQALLHRAYFSVMRLLDDARREERLPMLRALQTQVEIAIDRENGAA